MKPGFSLNLETMVRNFYLLTIFAFLIGGTTYLSVKKIGEEVSALKNENVPLLIAVQEMQGILDEISIKADAVLRGEGSEAVIGSGIEKSAADFRNSLKVAFKIAVGEEADGLKAVEKEASGLFKLLEGGYIDRSELATKLSKLNSSMKTLQASSVKSIENRFSASQEATNRAIIIVISLTLIAIAAWIALGLILSSNIGTPVSLETERLITNSRETEEVFIEINEGTRKQTDLVNTATLELEDMIINIIQGNVSLSVDKQTEIARAFSEFLRNFVERTTVEIAMGMMSVSHQSEEARNAIKNFTREVLVLEETIRAQEKVINVMAEALKSVVDANKEIREKAHSATKAADEATTQTYSGREKIGQISGKLDEIRNASMGVRDITDSLAKITEGIKILALNMSLKVEDIKDDTGKTYGFEAMSEKVQKLAVEVEGLLERSRNMINPTIQGIEGVSFDANQAREFIAEVVKSISVADEQSKFITARIDAQAMNIDKLEQEAEKLSALAHKTTVAVTAQGALAKNVELLLKDSETLIESVTSQTREASEAARKINQMMGQLRQTMSNIEDGTSRLTEKSAGISEMFDAIRELAIRNKSGAERLESVTYSIRDISNRLSKVVKGEAA